MQNGDIVCVTLYSGNQVIGRFSTRQKDELSGDVMLSLTDPKALLLEKESHAGIKIGVGALIGSPDFISFRDKDIFNYYVVVAADLLHAYRQATSSLTLGPLNLKPFMGGKQ